MEPARQGNCKAMTIHRSTHYTKDWTRRSSLRDSEMTFCICKSDINGCQGARSVDFDSKSYLRLRIVTSWLDSRSCCSQIRS